MNKFDEWNEIKKRLELKKYPLHFVERDIFYLRIGKNVGFEQDGKEYFLRPVLILRKYNKYFFTGIPLTTSAKDDIFHYKFNFIENKNSFAVLSQIKSFDANRLERKIGKISQDEFVKLKEKLRILLKL